MDDYEKWLISKDYGDLSSIYHTVQYRIHELEQRQQATQKILDELYSLEPSFRRIYIERVREENAKQQEKTL